MPAHGPACAGIKNNIAGGHRMQQTEINIFMQSLRGNQPLIVLAFLLIRSALTIEQLEALTGLHNDTVRSAVKGLAAKGLLYKQVGEHGRATWIPEGGTFFAKLFDQSPKTSDSAPVVVIVESEERRDLLSATTTTKRQNPKTSDSVASVKELQSIAALKEIGIYGTKARQLAKLEWVNPEYIRAHAEKIKGEMWDNPQGMIIRRIENDVPVQVAAQVGHGESCHCLKCKIAAVRGRSLKIDDDYEDEE